MARIRTIKPELPQSESLGRVSREARLLFVLLFTICDDAGRAKANSRILASLLYPLDDGEEGHEKTSGRNIDLWLDQLEEQGCIRRYEVDGNAYLDIPKWLDHQKIDHPSKSKIPEFREPSRVIAKKPETFAGEGKGMEGTRTGGEGTVATVVATPRADDDLEIPIKMDQTPEAHAAKMFNALAERIGLPACQKLTTGRRAKLKQRLIDCGGIEGWTTALEKLEASTFCRGKNNRGWRADIDFMCQEKTFTRLMEGFYDDRNRNQANDDLAAILEATGAGEMGSVGAAA
jgi:hypothetical protein